METRSEELMPCPVCGEKCETVRLEPGPYYRHSCEVRRAEIGRLVERLIDGRCLSVEDSGGDWITASLVQIVDGREVELGEAQGEVGLLDALRQLAKEVGGES